VQSGTLTLFHKYSTHKHQIVVLEPLIPKIALKYEEEVRSLGLRKVQDVLATDHLVLQSGDTEVCYFWTTK
jgi:hypothetical protein